MHIQPNIISNIKFNNKFRITKIRNIYNKQDPYKISEQCIFSVLNKYVNIEINNEQLYDEISEFDNCCKCTLRITPDYPACNVHDIIAYNNKKDLNIIQILVYKFNYNIDIYNYHYGLYEYYNIDPVYLFAYKNISECTKTTFPYIVEINTDSIDLDDYELRITHTSNNKVYTIKKKELYDQTQFEPHCLIKKYHKYFKTNYYTIFYGDGVNKQNMYISFIKNFIIPLLVNEDINIYELLDFSMAESLNTKNSTLLQLFNDIMMYMKNYNITNLKNKKINIFCNMYIKDKNNDNIIKSLNGYTVNKDLIKHNIMDYSRLLKNCDELLYNDISDNIKEYKICDQILYITDKTDNVIELTFSSIRSLDVQYNILLDTNIILPRILKLLFSDSDDYKNKQLYYNSLYSYLNNTQKKDVIHYLILRNLTDKLYSITYNLHQICNNIELFNEVCDICYETNSINIIRDLLINKKIAINEIKCLYKIESMLNNNILKNILANESKNVLNIIKSLYIVDKYIDCNGCFISVS